ncbi:aminomethyl-transferring glycine dehydrogenase subunit GcvPB [Gynuella sp.]|uniref:aminomethyl-transferring glycine dehydrogenase subunit GcvPB n=1 Tax=Gynuella sp. TaxID=2969146 RepID=UPI003D129809
MHSPYVVHSEQEVQAMLASMGLTDTEQLLHAIPKSIRLDRDLSLPAPLEEEQLDVLVRQIARNNRTVLDRISFLGGGLYEHSVPAVVDYLSERGEFLTGYTPYQPKMSQGLLEVLWEYQCQMQKLLGVSTVNTSSYDGSTAFVDAFNMVHFTADEGERCCFQLSAAVWPQTQQILESSLVGKAELFRPITWKDDGRIDLDILETQFVISPPNAFGFQCPNAFGVMEDIPAVVALCKKYHVTSVLYYHPMLSGVFASPGELGVDIVCGEGQMLGNHLNAGGATFGFLGCQASFADAIPGRIVGVQYDAAQQSSYALIREEREQHIARDKATSNICSNQTHCVIRAAIYLALRGSEGLKRIALKNAEAAHDFATELTRIEGINLRFHAPFFNEFVIEVKGDVQLLLVWLQARNIYGGTDLASMGMDNCLRLAVTETKTQVQLDEALAAFQEYFGQARQSDQSCHCASTDFYTVLPAASDSESVPALAEREVVRHYTLLSYKNYSVDTGMYPLGSCTMKYNPKRNDKYAAMDAFRYVHPLQPTKEMQGTLQILAELETYIIELTGMSAVSLQAAAGAQGELMGLLMMRKHFGSKGERRNTLLIADSAHGTNPSSAAMAGFRCEIVATNAEGMLDIHDLQSRMTGDVAGLMITNPSTLGLFEENIETVAEIVHGNGGLLYYDGANMNALMGLVRPGDMGFDIVHLNAHKTLSTPHGGGGPGAGPVAVTAALARYLPLPRIQYSPDTQSYTVGNDYPASIGTLKQYLGHFSVLIRAWAYIRTLGAKGLREASEYAILNANYVQYHLSTCFPTVFDKTCMHECLLNADSVDKSVQEISDIIIAQGFHPPTMVGAGCVWFPGALSKAILIEPTETESKSTLDAFIQAMKTVCC